MQKYIKPYNISFEKYGIDCCYDCTSEFYILQNYINKFDKHSNPLKISIDISNYINFAGFEYIKGKSKRVKSSKKIINMYMKWKQYLIKSIKSGSIGFENVNNKFKIEIKKYLKL